MIRLIEWAEEVRRMYGILRTEPPYTSSHELGDMIAAARDGSAVKRQAEVETALAEVGLPLNASVKDLIRHHRNNEAAAGGGWKIAYDALTETEAAKNR